MSIFKKWAQREYPLPVRLLATAGGALIFVLFIPAFFLHFGPMLDRGFGLSFGPLALPARILGGLFLPVGAFFALWSISDQLQRGKGTPIPALATQKLLIRGPFRYSRNPMGFGTCLAYLGLSLLEASPAMLLFTVIFTALFITYIKLVEEKELVERFGEDYRAYQESTPFFIPRMR